MSEPKSRPIHYKLDPLKQMNGFPYCTICEVQRRAWRLVDKHVEGEEATKIKALIEEAYDLGKRMDKKLREYKNNYEVDLLDKARPEDTYKEISA